jgi:hypothetical protein
VADYRRHHVGSIPEHDGIRMETMSLDENDQPGCPPSFRNLQHSNTPLFLCPITGYPCQGDLSYLCEDYGCARKGGLSPRSEENL